MVKERMTEPKEPVARHVNPRAETPMGPSSEGYPFPSMNSYVAALKNRLFIPEEERLRLHYTNRVRLGEWVPKIKLMESKRPPVRARLGRKGILISSDMELPERIMPETPVNQVLQAYALTLAKIAYLKEEAPQATSWGRGRLREREIRKQIDTILTSRAIKTGRRMARVSFKDVVSGLKPKKARLALATAGLALAACTGTVKRTIEPTPIGPVVTEVAPSPTLEPTETKEAPPTPVTIASGRPYPESDADFFLGAGGIEDAEERLRELGAGPDIDKMRAIGLAEMNRAGINPDNIEWVTEINELAENPSWTDMPRNRTTGRFLFPKLTTGTEAGQLVRSGNLFAYLDREIGDDFFDWVELQDPGGVENIEQRLVEDKSGWIVIGAFDPNGKMLYWFNAEKDEWVPASDFKPEVPYQVKNGSIMEWRDGGWREATLPEGTREIAIIEKHEGSWYGIDTYDRAVVKLNEQGEWEEFQRPIRIATWSKHITRETVLGMVQEDIDPEQEKRLVDGEGNVINYGYLGEQELKNKPGWVTMDISGYVRAGAMGQGGVWPYLIMEIPYRYERQIVLAAPPIHMDSLYSYLYVVPPNLSIEEAERRSIIGRDMVDAFNSPKAAGSQVIVRFLYKRDPYPLSENDWFRLGIEDLGDAIKRGEALGIGVFIDMNYLWASAALFE